MLARKKLITKKRETLKKNEEYLEDSDIDFDENINEIEMRGSQVNLENYETIQKSTPKKRGRKPKEVIVNALSCSPTPNAEMRQPVARGRGRPPKTLLNIQNL